MKREKNIQALIDHTKGAYIDLTKQYKASLKDKKINESLKIDIKNIFENLRSAFEYIANEIVESCCPNANSSDKLYFPIRNDLASFEKVMQKSYPDLKSTNFALYNYLESLQPYHNGWLNNFNKLNNNNKHQDLVEQTKTETKRIKVSHSGGGSVSWGQGVTFGKGISILGVPIDPATQLPIPNQEVKTEVDIWIDFKFTETNDSVLPFIDKTIGNVEQVYQGIKKLL